MNANIYPRNTFVDISLFMYQQHTFNRNHQCFIKIKTLPYHLFKEVLYKIDFLYDDNKNGRRFFIFIK